MRRPKRVWDAETLLRSQTLLDVTAGRKTSKEAAESLGITQPAVSKLEKNASKASLTTLQRYAAACGVSIKIVVE